MTETGCRCVIKYLKDGAIYKKGDIVYKARLEDALTLQERGIVLIVGVITDVDVINDGNESQA